MPAVVYCTHKCGHFIEISEFPRHRHDGRFSAQRACTRKFHMTSDRHDDDFQHPTCLCCIFLKLSHDDDWAVWRKCCIIWAEFFPDANNTLQSRLIFVGIRFIFCRFDAASCPPDTLIPLASFSFWAVLIQHYNLRLPLTVDIIYFFHCFDTASPARTKTGADFLFACMGWGRYVRR